MWIPKTVVDLFSSTRDDLVKAKAERDVFRDQLSQATILNDWFRLQINSLQNERVALLEKAYNIRVPVPQIERTPIRSEDTSVKDFSFDDVGNDLARKLGLPVYD
jgi:hypothetical protein